MGSGKKNRARRMLKRSDYGIKKTIKRGINGKRGIKSGKSAIEQEAIAICSFFVLPHRTLATASDTYCIFCVCRPFSQAARLMATARLPLALRRSSAIASSLTTFSSASLSSSPQCQSPCLRSCGTNLCAFCISWEYHCVSVEKLLACVSLGTSPVCSLDKHAICLLSLDLIETHK